MDFLTEVRRSRLKIMHMFSNLTMFASRSLTANICRYSGLPLPLSS